MNVVAATGAFQVPVVPALVSRIPGTDADPFERLSQSRPAAGGGCAGRRRGLVRGADRERAPSARASVSIFRSARTIARRAPIASATIAGGWACSGKWDLEAPGAQHRTRHHRGERRRWRPDDRLSAPRRCRHDPRRPDGSPQGRRANLCRRPGGLIWLAVTPTTCRCWTRPTLMSPATASIFRRSPRLGEIWTGSAMPDQSDPRAEPGEGRRHVDRLGDRLFRRLQLA